jgi:hypothetical protein
MPDQPPRQLLHVREDRALNLLELRNSALLHRDRDRSRLRNRRVDVRRGAGSAPEVAPRLEDEVTPKRRHRPRRAHDYDVALVERR